MKIGLIAECGWDGADLKVFSYAIHELAPDLKVVPAALGNKKNLLRDCGEAAMSLFGKGCKHVVVTWDLFPSHSTEKPCRKKDVEAIISSLKSAGVDMKKISLVCIEQELESWLIADRRALARALSTPEHPIAPNSIPKRRNPDNMSNPKAELHRIFAKSRSKFRRYVDDKHALMIAKLVDCRAIFKSPSFTRFANIIRSLAIRTVR